MWFLKVEFKKWLKKIKNEKFKKVKMKIKKMVFENCKILKSNSVEIKF